MLQALPSQSRAQGVSLTSIRDAQTRTITVLLNGPVGTVGTLQASADMRQWSTLQPFVLTAGPLAILDADAARFGHRFYRVDSAISASPLPDLANLANAVFTPGEGFDTVQYAPSGKLGHIAWRNRELIFRERTTSGNWTETVVASDGRTFNTSAERQYSNFQPAALLLYGSDSVPHVFKHAGGNSIAHYRQNNGAWQLAETISAPGTALRLVGAVGTQNSFHLGILTDNALVHGLGRNNSWNWSTVDSVAPDATWTPGSFSRRWLSLAVDPQNFAHFAYRPSFDYTRHPEGYMRANTKLKYASNARGSWASQIVREPDDISGEAGSGQSIAIAPNGKPAIASWYNERGDGGSSQWSRLQFYEMSAAGGWARSEVLSRPSNYIAGDGEKGTGAYPYLRYDSQGRPHILFTDHASEHFPYQNEYAGNLRHGVRVNGQWQFETVLAQDKPLQQQIVFPAFAVGSSEVAFLAMERLTSWNTSVNPQVATSTYKVRFFTRPLN